MFERTRRRIAATKAIWAAVGDEVERVNLTPAQRKRVHILVTVRCATAVWMIRQEEPWDDRHSAMVRNLVHATVHRIKRFQARERSRSD